MVAVQHDFSDAQTKLAAAVVTANHMQAWFQRGDLVDRLEEQHNHTVETPQQVRRALGDLQEAGYVERDGHYYRIVR
ncbi:hypothetical protein GLU01_01555 [Nanohaloarchaea archaeon]|jgi:hypothetical protein|nr:hypothetical protein [Candidatus Nanohaloarchaea archaeon]